MIHPETMKVVNYPNTKGKQIAMKHFNWDKLTKEEEVIAAKRIIKMAKEIDDEFNS